MHRRLHLLLAMLIWILWIVSNNNNNSNNYHNDTKSIWSVCHRPLASSHENAIVKSSFVLQLRRRTAGQNLWYNKHSIKTAWQSKWWVYEFNVHKILFFVFFFIGIVVGLCVLNGKYCVIFVCEEESTIRRKTWLLLYVNVFHVDEYLFSKTNQSEQINRLLIVWLFQTTRQWWWWFLSVSRECINTQTHRSFLIQTRWLIFP